MSGKVIDQTKLLNYLNELANDYTGLGVEAVKYVKWRIEESNDFDPDTPPVPTIKPGDTRQLLHNTINVMTDQQVKMVAKSLGLEVVE